MKKWIRKRNISKVELSLVIILCSIIFLIYGGMTILKFGVHSSTVSGESMENTLSNGTKLLSINREFKKIKRGDIVSILFYEGDKRGNMVKRVIALPNETINIKSNKVYINGKLLDEPYAYYSGESKDDLEVTLSEEAYFVMGDNRLASIDSRVFGPIDEKLIVGVILKFKKSEK